MGGGRFSEKMGYKNWVNFNNSLRAYFNYLEAMPVMIAYVFVTALWYPWVGFGLGVAFVFGRFLYTIGYRIKADARVAGALFTDLAILGGLVMSIVSIAKMQGTLG